MRESWCTTIKTTLQNIVSTTRTPLPTYSHDKLVHCSYRIKTNIQNILLTAWTHSFDKDLYVYARKRDTEKMSCLSQFHHNNHNISLPSQSEIFILDDQASKIGPRLMKMLLYQTK